MKFLHPKQGLFEGFWLGQLLGILLLVLSYVLIAVNSTSVVFSSQVLEAVFAESIWGTTLARNLFLFGLAMAFLHSLFAMICWVVGRISARAWPSPKVTLRQHVTVWFLALTIGLLANNAATFPKSWLGSPYAEPMGLAVLGIPIGRWVLIAALAGVATTIAVALLRWWKAGGRASRRTFATLGALGLAYLAVSAHSILPQERAAPSSRPNIILIGLDSLRSDLFDPSVSPGVTPHVDEFLKNGTQFTNAITPLARTFPSMMAMLTGRAPHHTGAVMNLLPRDQVQDGESLPRILAHAGYRTAYATDEVRFSNIDASYGFEQAIHPPIGASEFLIAQLADTPVSNLALRTPLIKWLFPHLNGNRGAAAVYDPDHFVQRLDDELDVSAPMFINVHLTLAHWPYTWADSPPMKRNKADRWPEYYLHAARRVDQQFADVLAVLERKGLLDNAVVVVYSDHGESFSSPQEALVADKDPLIEALHIKPSWGHGTTVLTAHQYHIVLGMRRYGQDGGGWATGAKSNAPVSFEDIAPTIVDALDVPGEVSFDGRSLLGLLERRPNAEQAFKGRIRFTETEFFNPLLATAEGKVSSSELFRTLLVYRVDPVSDRIEVKRSHLANLLIDRQYAAIGDTQLLAAVPRKGAVGQTLGQNFITAPLNGGALRQLPDEMPAGEAELQALWKALNAEFVDIIDARRKAVATPTVANREQTIPAGVTK